VITVIGEVKEPGMYNVMRPTTVIESLALAKGQTPDAKLESVIVFRRHERRIIARRLNLHNRFELNSADDFFYLRPDDIVYVPRTRISELAHVMNKVREILMFRGWFVGFTVNDRVDWISGGD
jgi:polysaccharide export outer membrane protein